MPVGKRRWYAFVYAAAWPLRVTVMVLWCKNCSALMGLAMPFEDWSTNTDNLCKECATAHLNDATEKPDEVAETVSVLLESPSSLN